MTMKSHFRCWLPIWITPTTSGVWPWARSFTAGPPARRTGLFETEGMALPLRVSKLQVYDGIKLQEVESAQPGTLSF